MNFPLFRFLPVLLFSGGLFSSALGQISAVNIKENWQTQKGKSLVPLRQYEAFLPKDAFMAVQFPDALIERTGRELYAPEEPLAVIRYKSVEKAYPLSYLIYHGIINDRIGGIAVAVTFCPLTNAVKAYRTDQFISGLKTSGMKLGNTGMLRWGNMVMYDENTESWWQQINGKCLTGEWSGQQFPAISAVLMDVETYFENYPYGFIQQPITRTRFPYGQTPYYRFDQNAFDRPIFFPFQNPGSLPAMQLVGVVQFENRTFFFPLNDSFKDQALVFSTDYGKEFYLFAKQGVHSVHDELEIKTAKKNPSVNVFTTELDGNSNWEFFYSSETEKFHEKITGTMWDFSGKCTDGSLIGKKLDTVQVSVMFSYAAFTFFPEGQLVSLH